jgi:hypothetical protein
MAKDDATEELVQLEARINELKNQQVNRSEVVESHYREILQLQLAIADARIAMRKGAGGERALRQRAEALSSVIHRIELSFTAQKKEWRKKAYRLVRVTIYPLVGEPMEMAASSSSLGSLGPKSSLLNQIQGFSNE